MKIGISTASLFGRYKTEDAITFLDNNKVETAEVFLESFCEYNKKFGKLLLKRKKDIDIHSVHVLTTQYEPTICSQNERAREDSFKLLDGAMACAEKLNAKYYTFHGTARLKKLPIHIDFDHVGKYINLAEDVCEKHGVQIAYENVHWCYYNYIGFFNELKKRVPRLKATFDVKQARLSNVDYKDYIKEMGSDIVTVHLSDIDENGKMCLPGKGITDYNDIFSRLKDVGFDGAMLLEVYKGDFIKEEELFSSLEYIKELKDKIF